MAGSQGCRVAGGGGGMKWKSYLLYKNSGSEWLSEIPEHWTAKKLKYIARQIVDGTHLTPTYVENGVAFLRVTDIHSGTIDFSEVKRIPIEEHTELIKRCYPERGNLLL
ncbi:MAG: hypothetical protein LLG06_07895, partial [Desulfobacteraceae bacterium]|nr:hypothetical protein [Desulfobacteraceae bacterium]